MKPIIWNVFEEFLFVASVLKQGKIVPWFPLLKFPHRRSNTCPSQAEACDSGSAKYVEISIKWAKTYVGIEKLHRGSVSLEISCSTTNWVYQWVYMKYVHFVLENATKCDKASLAQKLTVVFSHKRIRKPYDKLGILQIHCKMGKAIFPRTTAGK